LKSLTQNNPFYVFKFASSWLERRHRTRDIEVMLNIMTDSEQSIEIYLILEMRIQSLFGMGMILE
jgi:hypothetical protein